MCSWQNHFRSTSFIYFVPQKRYFESRIFVSVLPVLPVTEEGGGEATDLTTAKQHAPFACKVSVIITSDDRS
jgi:hypothetical protein